MHRDVFSCLPCTLLDKAGSVESEYYSHALPVMLKLTMHSGMRQGEVFGLTWD